jgi:electron transfer flavoprotein beta subunit
LKIIVCVKQVPDSAARVVVENGRVSWGDAPLVINPWDEYAVEAALVQKEAQGGEVIALSVGGESAVEALKHALAMGADEAVLISDPALGAADSQAVAYVLSAAIKKLGGVDLVFCGRQAIDGDIGMTHLQTGRLLGWPALTLVSNVKVSGGTLTVEKSLEEGRQIVSAQLPAVVSVIKDIGEPRYPSFMGIRKASRAIIPTWTLADLGMPAPQPVVSWPQVTNPPAREVVTEIIRGDSPADTAAKLVEKILAEGVL